jgi:hypothetical protein
MRSCVIVYSVEVDSTKRELAEFGEMRPKGRGKRALNRKALTCFMCVEGSSGGVSGLPKQ